MKVLFVGRPNAGKSSLFNAVTGARAKVGNFPGVTVEVLEARGEVGGQAASFVDLPGLYTLDDATAAGTDEAITRELLRAEASRGGDALVVLVADATHLAPSLGLLRELRVTVPETRVLVAVSQGDALAAEGRELRTERLGELLGVPVVATSARSKTCREDVLGAIARAQAAPEGEGPDFDPVAVADEVVVTVQSKPKLRARSNQVDRVLLHPVLGPVFFVAIMAAMFSGVFLIGDPVSSVLDAAMAWIGSWLRPALGGGAVASLVVDGALKGAGTVLAFLPQVILVIAFLELLEATGYLARTAFLVDRLLRLFGLGGKSFVPMLTGHACAVPAISATRVLRDPKERLRTILIIPLMTCSARLPVYALVVSAFFGDSALVKIGVATGLYFAGLLAGLVASLVLRRTVVRGRTLPLVLELPVYRMPLFRALLSRCRIEAVEFVRRVGTVILAASVVLWVLLHVPVRGAHAPDEPSIERSAAAWVGQRLEPVTRPLGFDWRINVGLIGSFGARELMVGTMGVIFGVEDAEEKPTPLVEKLKSHPGYGRPTAVALLVFFVIACQCMSTLAAIRRETHSWKMPLFVLGYTYAAAYLLAFIAHTVTRWVI